MVLQNSVLFGSVNANRHHYEQAAKALAQADPGWLTELITRRVPLEDWAGRLRPQARRHQDHPGLPGRVLLAFSAAQRVRPSSRERDT
jgi:Glucose dehydrogenase C-terminus